MPEIRKYTSASTPVILVGTKEDLLESSETKVDFKTALRAATEMGCSKFLPCSSLTHWALSESLMKPF
uniref:Uncharacterized protein n=1 Tax=Ditylenchus dipsaci TaxID=166011 RepID=A0A915CL80_9BILA